MFEVYEESSVVKMKNSGCSNSRRTRVLNEQNKRTRNIKPQTNESSKQQPIR